MTKEQKNARISHMNSFYKDIKYKYSIMPEIELQLQKLWSEDVFWAFYQLALWTLRVIIMWATGSETRT